MNASDTAPTTIAIAPAGSRRANVTGSAVPSRMTARQCESGDCDGCRSMPIPMPHVRPSPVSSRVGLLALLSRHTGTDATIRAAYSDTTSVGSLWPQRRLAGREIESIDGDLPIAAGSKRRPPASKAKQRDRAQAAIKAATASLQSSATSVVPVVITLSWRCRWTGQRG